MAYLNRSDSSSCCACWHSSSFNPKTWNLTAKRVAELAAIVVGICAMAILVSGLMVQYPEASGAFFTAFGIVGAAGLIAMTVALVKHCRQPKLPKFMD